MKKLGFGLLFVMGCIFNLISAIFTVMCIIVLDPLFILCSGTVTVVAFYINKMLYRKARGIEKPKLTDEEITARCEKIGGILGNIFGYAICIGLVIGAIALAGFILVNLFGLIGFVLDILLFIGGLILAVSLIGGFLSFWWDLVKWEHVYKPRGYVRVKRRKR